MNPKESRTAPVPAQDLSRKSEINQSVAMSEFQPQAPDVADQRPRNKWRFCRRCARIPNLFFVNIELAILIAAAFSMLVDAFLIALWSTYRHLWVMADDLIFQSDITRLNGELIVMQVFCFVSNLCLLIGSRLRFPLLCLSWVTIRIIWLYYALIAWNRALNLNEVLKNRKSGDQNVRYDIMGNTVDLPDGDLNVIWNLSIVVIYLYLPLMIIFVWITLATSVFIFKVMEANERRRRSSPVSIYINPEHLRKLSNVPDIHEA